MTLFNREFSYARSSISYTETEIGIYVKSKHVDVHSHTKSFIVDTSVVTVFYHKIYQKRVTPCIIITKVVCK